MILKTCLLKLFTCFFPSALILIFHRVLTVADLAHEMFCSNFRFYATEKGIKLVSPEVDGIAYHRDVVENGNCMSNSHCVQCVVQLAPMC